MRCAANGFSVAHLHSTDTFIVISRPESADETVEKGRAHSLHGAGEAFALNQNNFTECETLRFVPLSRHRATAITVSVQPECASEKTTPQSASLTAPLTQGSQWEVRHKICSAVSGSGSFTVSSVFSIPGTGNHRIRSCVRAPLKSCVRGGGSALAEPVGLFFQNYSLFIRRRSLRRRASANLHRAYGKRQLSGFRGNFDTGQAQ